MSRLLDNIKTPDDVKALNNYDLSILCNEIREFLISSISKTGGHIGTNLGVVELTVALHYVFGDKDKIIFDTGHQGYTHKLLTGRKNMFSSLNQPNGMSRFICREESRYDVIDASHAGTAISIASGIAVTKKLAGEKGCAVALVGDGALVEGMSLEGLNFGTADNISLVIVVNDNGMAIPPNVGGIKNLFTGKNTNIKSKNFFEGLGYQYIYVSDGHNVEDIVNAFKQAKLVAINGAVVVHAKTKKGKGLDIAKDHKYKLHFSMPFDPETGEGCSPVPTGKTYAMIAGCKLYELLEQDKKIIAITPSTPYASGLDDCLTDFPDRTIDVGMAEQHALGMACGLALNGYKPFICYQATFMQRAIDQIIHDACFMDIPVTILAVRSGFSGYDSHTHHGIYDMSFLRGIPNLKIFYPGSSSDLEQIMQKRADNPEGPMVILHPYECVSKDDAQYIDKSGSIEGMQIIKEGKDGFILSVGNTLDTAMLLSKKLAGEKQKFGVANIRWIKPLPEKQLLKILNCYEKVITTEEHVLNGGFGASIAELICDNNLNCDLYRSGIDDGFVKPGDKDELSFDTAIDADSIYKKVKERWS